MKKILMLILCIGLIPALYAAKSDIAPQNAPDLQAPYKADFVMPEFPATRQDTLLAQYPSMTAIGMACQHDPAYPFDAWLLDDVIPDVDWTVEEVVSWWANWNGFTSWTNVPEIYFQVYEDSGLAYPYPKMMPAQQVTVTQANYTATTIGTDQYLVVMNLPSTISLLSGQRYWICVQPNNQFTLNGQTGWMGEPGIGNGQECYFAFPLLGNNKWTTATAVFGSPNEAGFVLMGSGGPGLDHDVGVTAILEPAGTYFLNDPVTPTAQVRNFGNNSETFPVVFTMERNMVQVYADTVSMTLASGAIDTAVFAGYTFTQEGTYDVVGYTVLAGDENPGNDTVAGQAHVYAGLIPYLIIDADPTPLTGPWLDTKFQSWGYSGLYTTNTAYLHADSMAIYQTVWVCLGIFSYNYALTNDQASAIGTYLNNGGRAYVEGGDSWGYDGSRTILCPLFGIDPNTTLDGSADLSVVTGMSNGQIPEVNGHNWTYTGYNNWIDQLGLYATPPNGGTVEGFLRNTTVNYWTGAAYNQGTWKGVGLSHELGGDVPGTISGDSLLYWIAMYLEIGLGVAEQPVGNEIGAIGFAPMANPVRGQALIAYALAQPAQVCLKVYDRTGRLVETLVNASQTAGQHTVTWDARNVASGVYFLRLDAGDQTATQKLVLID